MVLTDKDLVKSRGKIGGYLINSGNNLQDNTQTGGNPAITPILSGLQNLAVPLGLVYLQQKASNTPAGDIINTINKTKNKVGVISETLYDRLLNLVTDKEKKTKQTTKKRKIQIKKDLSKTNNKSQHKKTKRRK